MANDPNIVNNTENSIVHIVSENISIISAKELSLTSEKKVSSALKVAKNAAESMKNNKLAESIEALMEDHMNAENSILENILNNLNGLTPAQMEMKKIIEAKAE